MKQKKTLRDFLGEQCDISELCRNDYEYYVRETGIVTEHMTKFKSEDLAIVDFVANKVIVLNGDKYDIRREPITTDDVTKRREWTDHMKKYGYEKVPEEALDKYIGI